MTNIILCGGAGTRLWPLSRRSTPKQFCDLLGGQTLFERTVSRNAALAEAWLIVTGAEQYPLAAEQFAAVSPRKDAGRFILEPLGRNTAPAIALACLGLPRDELVLVTPSDHEITDQVAYEAAIRAGMAAATLGKLVTFGIKPEQPETGYGYIEADSGQEGQDWREVLSFREKPDSVTAVSYMVSGRHYWNSGMFCFSAGAFLDELGRHSPAMLETARRARESALAAGGGAAAVLRIPAEAMKAIPADSIDYAVMEKSDRVAVVPCSIGWSDLGSWDAIYALRDKDGAGNAADATLLSLESGGNLVVGGGRRIALVGIDDLIVIDSPDALLIMRRGQSQDAKKAVEALRAGSAEDQLLL